MKTDVVYFQIALPVKPSERPEAVVAKFVNRLVSTGVLTLHKPMKLVQRRGTRLYTLQVDRDES